MPIKAVQQFQIRTVIRTEKEAIATLNKMKAAGFEGIELCSFMIKKMSWKIRLLTRLAGMPMGNSGHLDWNKIIKETGLRVVSIHQDLGSVIRNTEEVVAEVKVFQTPYVVITGMHRFDYSDADAVTQLAQQLNEAGEKLLASGIHLLYHNHNCELRRVNKDMTAFELLIELTDQRFVNFELDSYWLAEAGANPLEFMKRLGNRMKLYHINDRGSRVEGKKSSILTSDSMELGTGNMDLESLIAQALKVEVDGIVLETHRNWIHKSPIASFEMSGAYLAKFSKVGEL